MSLKKWLVITQNNGVIDPLDSHWMVWDIARGDGLIYIWFSFVAPLLGGFGTNH